MTVGAIESYVTVRSVPPAVVCALPAGSATDPVNAITTSPWPEAVVISVKEVPEPDTVNA